MSPEGLGVTWQPADDLDAVVALVDAELERLEDEGRDRPASAWPPSTPPSATDCDPSSTCAAGSDRDSGRVVCENVHRLKGLEFDTVILASPDDEDDVAVLYVGVSRAVSELIVVGPDALSSRLGLTGSSTHFGTGG